MLIPIKCHEPKEKGRMSPDEIKHYAKISLAFLSHSIPNPDFTKSQVWKAPELSHEERIVLNTVVESPLNAMTALQKSSALKKVVWESAVKGLIEKAVLKEVKVPGDGTRATFFDVTQFAIDTLLDSKSPYPRRRRSSFVHFYFQTKIAELILEQFECETFIEHHDADVAAPHLSLALEVAVTSFTNLPERVEKNAGLGWSTIIVTPTKIEREKAMRSLGRAGYTNQVFTYLEFAKELKEGVLSWS